MSLAAAQLVHMSRVKFEILTVELPADVKLGDSEKNIIASKDRGGHGV